MHPGFLTFDELVPNFDELFTITLMLFLSKRSIIHKPFTVRNVID